MNAPLAQASLLGINQINRSETCTGTCVSVIAA